MHERMLDDMRELKHRVALSKKPPSPMAVIRRLNQR